MRRKTLDARLHAMRRDTLDASLGSCLASTPIVSCPASHFKEFESPVMLSALQHYLFCPRQCALIHVEGVWSENYLTAAGRQLHERVDQKGGETRRDVHIATALRIVSKRLGLTGVADMVEFHRQDSSQDLNGRTVAVKLPRRNGSWRPFPVEYKRGVPKSHCADEVQLCAQALCLEEMLNVFIPKGALFYGAIRRRVEVPFDEDLRLQTESVASKVHSLLDSGETPPPILTKGCKACSLADVCLPEETNPRNSVRHWIKDALEAAGI